ncbi:MAG TPA: hypothetical protein VHS96_13865 [Bacteroidia bacterium]|nr:hypothetical protein [Bacteroidia bacterium]
MDDGHKLTVKAWSAADAIQSALGKHIGHKVQACCAGLDTKYGGTITYDIPAHVALVEKPKRAKRTDDTLARCSTLRKSARSRSTRNTGLRRHRKFSLWRS